MRPTRRYNILIGDETYKAELWKNHFHYGRGWIISLPGNGFWYLSDPSVNYMKRSVRKEFPEAKFEAVY